MLNSISLQYIYLSIIALHFCVSFFFFSAVRQHESAICIHISGLSKQSVIQEINPEYSLEGLMLKLQYLGHLMGRANSLAKTLMLGKI